MFARVVLATMAAASFARVENLFDVKEKKSEMFPKVSLEKYL